MAVRSARCLEIVGLPGTGKSTLSGELKKRHGQVRLEIPPDWKRAAALPFYLWNCFTLIPIWGSMAFGRGGRWLNQEVFFKMIYLNGWARRLARERPDRAVIVLDQGPVFMLSQVILYKDGHQPGALFDRWWGRILGTWRRALDGIVLLDASNEILIDRINGRHQDHMIKGVSSDQARGFLERRRAVLRQAIGALTLGSSAPRVARFDTGQEPFHEIVTRLPREFGFDGPPVRRPGSPIMTARG